MKKEFKSLSEEELENLKKIVAEKMKELYPTEKDLKKAIKILSEKK